MSVSRQTLKYCIAACDLGSRSHVIGAVIFSLRVKVQWSHLFPLSCLLTVCYQLNRSCSAQFTAPHAAVWWKRILCVASDWVMTGERRQHLCNFTLLCHVHTSLSYSHFFSICVDLFPPFTPLKSSPEEKKKKKVSVSVYLFVFRVFARIIAWAYLWLPCVLVWLCWEVAKSTKRKKKKENFKSIFWKSQQLWKSLCEEKLFLCCCCQHCELQGKRSRNTEWKHSNWTQSEIFNLHRNLCRQVHIYTVYIHAHAHIQVDCCHFSGDD